MACLGTIPRRICFTNASEHTPPGSDYCRHCPYDPKEAAGEKACPFTTLFWDFLLRHRERFEGHPRIGALWRNLERMETARIEKIRRRAEDLREQLI